MDKAELKQLSVRTIDRARAAIAAGNTEDALRLFDETVAVKKGFHDFMCEWANMLFQKVGDLGGDEAVLAVHREYAKLYRLPVIKEWQAAGADRSKFPWDAFLRARAKMFETFHDAALEFEEDEEKYTLSLKPCDSGGYLVNKFGGKNPAHFKSKSPQIYYYDDFPYYCGHCPMVWEAGPYEEEQLGYPLIIFNPPQKPGDPCVQHYYKDPRNIPDEYYERIGRPRKI